MEKKVKTTVKTKKKEKKHIIMKVKNTAIQLSQT